MPHLEDEWPEFELYQICEICKKESMEAVPMTVEGIELTVCPDCAATCCRVGKWRAR
jgi:ribosome-binding protein aMBF1 (putative translation factor)